MLLLHDLDGLRHLPRGGGLSIGNFDGVHRGHAAIIDRLRAVSGAGGPVSVVTFEPHPLTVLRPELAPPRLTPAAARRRLLERLGVTHLVELPPSPEVLNLTGEQFFAILRDQVCPAHIVEGPNFNFGKGRGGNVLKMIEWAAGSGTRVSALPAERVVLADKSVVEVSSTLVRWLLAHGRVRDAGICLGRPYAITGEVIRGFQRGRTIGIPTANLDVRDQMVPDDGVYAGRCTLGGVAYPAAVSIGWLPTFAERAFQVEAHLLGFDGDLYGQTVEVELLDYVREQRRYAGIEALKAQIDRDLLDIRRRAEARDGHGTPEAAESATDA